MEPLNDRELSEMLAEWKAPEAPPTLRARVLPARQPWWRWMLTGTIRIPAPVALAAALVAAIWIYVAATARPAATGSEPGETNPVVSLADFEPVERVEPRVVGESR
jgi:ferric-dicitrate binding protein FerR (iron transport regulator)